MENDAKSGLKPGIKVEMPEHAMAAGTAENQYGISFRDLDLESGTVGIIQKPLQVFSYELEGNERCHAAQLYNKDERGRYIIEVDEHVAKVAQTLDGELFASQVPITMVSRVGITTEYRDVYINL